VKVRNGKMMAVVAAASLGLSACSVPVALSDTNATLGASQYLQVHLSANLFVRNPSLAKVIKIIKPLTFDINYQGTTSAPLASSLNTAKSEIVVFNGTQKVLTIVNVHSNEYLNVNISSLANIQGLGLTAAKLAPVNLILGSRWFEFPHSLITKYESSTLHIKASKNSTAVNDVMLVDALVTFFANQPTTTTSTGFTQTGTFASLQKALAAIVKSATTSPSTVTALKTAPGTYKLAVTMNGSVATAAKLAITTPDGKYGDGTLTLNATFAQQSLNIATPSNALVITPAFLSQIAALGSTKISGTNGGGILSGALG